MQTPCSLLTVAKSTPVIEDIMARLSWTQRLYWRYFSKPVSERALFLHVLENPVGSILEIGIGAGERARKLIPLCEKPQGINQIRYAGVDPFESADAGVPHLNLKQAHRMLAEMGVKAHLIPGETASSIARVAHSVLPSDLVIIDGEWEQDSSAGKAIATWLPRLCHSQSKLFVASTRGGLLQLVAAPETAVDSSSLRRAA